MELTEFIYPAAIAVTSTLALCLIRGIALRIAGKWSGKTSTGIDDAWVGEKGRDDDLNHLRIGRSPLRISSGRRGRQEEKKRVLSHHIST
jgi:hypothetical protein